MNYYTSYIILIFFVKILYILFSFTHIYLKTKGQENTDLDNKIVYWKDRLEFIFKFLMSLLLIFLFSPTKGTNVVINGETKVLLYLFGFVLLITAPWDNFIKEANWFKQIQFVIG